MTTARSLMVDRATLPWHAALFHSGDSDRAAQMEFVRPALEQTSETVMLWGAAGVPAQLRRALERHLGRSLDSEVARGKVRLEQGDPDPDAQLRKFARTVRLLAEKGDGIVRVLGQAAWEARSWPAPEDFLWFESVLDDALRGLPVAVLCSYDVTALPGPALLYGGLETHARIALDGRVVPNPFARAPGAFLSERLLRLPWLTGRTGIGLTRGVHACGFFASHDQEYRVLLPLIQEGIDRGDASVHIIDPARRADHLARLQRAGIIAPRPGSPLLDIRDWQETYLSEGRFDADRMLRLLDELLSTSGKRTRLIADMAWALGHPPGSDALVQYEARINESLPRPADTVICTYDSASFSAATVLDILRAHPYVIMGDAITDNGLYTPPAALIHELHDRVEHDERAGPSV